MLSTILSTILTVANNILANQRRSSIVTDELVLVESRSALHTSTTTDVIAVIPPVYGSLARCQRAQMFLSLFHTNPYRF